IETMKIPESEGVVIYGKGPAFLYSYLTLKYGHALWTAVYSPQNNPIIVSSKITKYKVGDSFGKETILKHIPYHQQKRKYGAASVKVNKKIIAFLGPPNSGKSVFLNAIKLQLQNTLPSEFFHNAVFAYRACPDAEGDWFYKTPVEEVKKYGYEYQYDEEFVEKACEQLQSLKEEKDLMLVDCGGKIDKRNSQIWDLCTHAIIISSVPSKITEWRGGAAASGLNILAEVESVLDGTTEIISIADPIVLRVGKLERGNSSVHVPPVLIERITNGLHILLPNI
ncbi:MAG: hypothetical protein KGJ59_12525, partial [Bacteroidota bacterium]|nr:hypothetical protein [Bacteroidota bacterium]